MRCSYKPQVNSLWSIWYCLLISTLTGYLTYLGVRRYIVAHAHYQETEWSHQYDSSLSATKIYWIISVALNCLVLVLLPFFIAVCCFKVGNLASDNERLGERTKKIVDVLIGTPLCRKFKSAWQHGPPVAQTVHLSMAFALLMAHTLMETQFFKFYYHQESSSNILKSEEIWSTDLEFLYRNQDDKLTQLIRDKGGKDRLEMHDPDSMMDHRYSAAYHGGGGAAGGFGGGGGSIDYERDTPFQHRSPFGAIEQQQPSSSMDHQLVSSADIAPKILPLLSNFRLYGVSLLFVNYAMALFIYAAVYPSVYWRANKAFSFVFSCHLFLHAITSLFGFLGFQLLYRYQSVNNDQSSRPPYILNEYLLIVVYLCSCVVLFFASSVVYGYGYNKFCLRLLSTAINGGNGSGSGGANGGSTVARRLPRLRGPKTYPICCEGYSPHISAILMLILMVASKAPLLYDQMILYQKHFKPITLICIVVDVAYLFAWILLWLALTLKREWAFKVRYTNEEIGALLGLQTDEGRPITNGTLMVMCADDYFATDDEPKKTAVLQLAEKCGLGQHEDEVYWLKPTSHDHQQHAGSPEMNNLLGSNATAVVVTGGGTTPRATHHHQQPPNHYSTISGGTTSKAATIGVSGGHNYYKRYGVNNNHGNGNGNNGSSTLAAYSKVSFSDGEDPTLFAKHQQQRGFAQTRAGSGSYVRFSDDQQSALGLINYDDQPPLHPHHQHHHNHHDVVSTFGTLPRQAQDYPRRRVHQQGDETDGNQYQPYGAFAPGASAGRQPHHHGIQTVANAGPFKRTPSPLSSPQQQPDGGGADTQPLVTYASVHKRSSSPGFRTAEYGRILQQQQIPTPPHSIVPGVGDTQTDSQNVSRVSSYANLPQAKQNWDASSITKMDTSLSSSMSRPPTGRTGVVAIMPGGGGQPQQQQYHHHQHHYSMGAPGPSPQPYSTLPHPNSGTASSGLPQHQQQQQGTPNARRPVPYTNGKGGGETVVLHPRASPKHSPSLEPEGYSGHHQNGGNGGNVNGRKLTSFSNSSSASGTAGLTGDSSDTTPTQQSYGGLLAAPPHGALTTSASSSSREMTPLSNASGTLTRQSKQQPGGGNWHAANPIYGQPPPPPGPAPGRSYTPQSTYGSLTPGTPASATSAGASMGMIGDPATAHAHHQPYASVYYNNNNGAGGGARPRPVPAGAPAGAADSSGAPRGTNSTGLLGMEPHDRNDSANFSLTSSNESENNQFVTSIV